MIKERATGFVLAGLCLLMAGCGVIPFGDSGKFDDALKKITLPPGTGKFEIHGDDTTDFFITMTFSDRGEAEIATF